MCKSLSMYLAKELCNINDNDNNNNVEAIC